MVKIPNIYRHFVIIKIFFKKPIDNSQASRYCDCVMNEKVVILGINSDKDTCDCCGKKNLKRVIWLQFEGSDAVAYGTSCAAKALGVNGTYSAKDAEKVVHAYQSGLELKQDYTAKCESARVEANRLGEAVGVFKNGGSPFYTCRMKAAETNPGLYGFPRAVFNPL
jgi:hypothetical protein